MAGQYASDSTTYHRVLAPGDPDQDLQVTVRGKLKMTVMMITSVVILLKSLVRMMKKKRRLVSASLSAIPLHSAGGG